MENETMNAQAPEQKSEKKRQPIEPYLKALPWVLQYNIIVVLLSGLIIWGLRVVVVFLIFSTGRVAITSGDFQFLLTTWQGWAILLIVIVVLFFMVSVEVNGLLLIADKAVHGQPILLRESIAGAFRSIRRLMNRQGLIFSIYIALAVPLTGIGISLSRTKDLYIPDFISSVIWSTPLYLVIYLTSIAALILFGFRNLFFLPFLVIDGLPPKEAAQKAHAMMKAHWRNFIFHIVVTLIRITLLLLLAFAVAYLLVTLSMQDWGKGETFNRFFLCSSAVLTLFVSSIGALCILTIEILEIVRLFTGYKDNRVVIIPTPERKVGWYRIFVIPVILVGIAGLGLAMAVLFDVVFPADRDVPIIAHRLGGNEGPENSIEGWRIAREAGAWGFETDIQRAKDGTYVINHDKTFNRCCGVDKSPSEMTWKEIRKLRIRNLDGTVSGEHPPSLKELLDAVQAANQDGMEGGHLFLELKGPTADKQMADDVCKEVRKRGMTEQCTIISLKYDLVSYVNRKYEDVETGYLYFFSYGINGGLDCDDLIVEEESASAEAIEDAHLNGRKMMIWTINKESAAGRVMDTDADGVITDEITMCRKMREQLANRTDAERVLSRLKLMNPGGSLGER